MLDPTITYYCIQETMSLTRLALEWQKIQEIDRLNSTLERQIFISETIVAYSKLIRIDISLLMHMYFKSAYENLTYAMNATAQNQREYLMQAKNRFIDAITIEKNENLILSFIGLALCQASLLDIPNSRNTLERIKTVSLFLPDDYNELCKMWRWNHEVQSHFIMFFAQEYFSINCGMRSSYEYLSDAEKFIRYKVQYYPLDMRNDICSAFIRFVKAGAILSQSQEKMIKSWDSETRQIIIKDFDCFKKDIMLNFVI